MQTCSLRLAALCLLLTLSVAGCAHTATDKERSRARTRHDIGVAMLGQGDVRAALRELLGAIELDPELAEAHNALGLIFHSMRRYDDALLHYNRAVFLAPKFSEAHNNRGVLLLAMGRYDDAIPSFKLALSDILYGTPSLAEGNLGWAHYKNGDVDRGLRHLRNAVAMNPKFCRGYGWLAEIELERKKPSQVVAHCKRFEKHCIDDPTVGKIPPDFTAAMAYRLGTGYAELGDNDAARAAFGVCNEIEADQASGWRVKCQRSLATLK